ncbi:MAG: F0F1 ATP synthase subunit gamma, partial [Oscillospiraceae bacterium]|nr:F0F1 ATP synthase subunit gamma [Oscillospiraceae bacterium]
ITNAMKLVSAGKLRKAKATFEKTNENFHYITNTIAEIFHKRRAHFWNSSIPTSLVSVERHASSFLLGRRARSPVPSSQL